MDDETLAALDEAIGRGMVLSSPNAMALAALEFLTARGLAVVPVEPVPEGAANYADIALQDAMVEIEDNGHRIHVYKDDLFAKSLAGNGFAVVKIPAALPKEGQA